jgi:hypothetical protein
VEMAASRCYKIHMSVDNADRKYWFPAKRYGWGWGPPVTWQGWAVFLGWFAVLISGTVYFIPRRPAAFVVFTLAMGLLLVAIGYLKGEPPRWRWGDRDEP